MPPKVKLSKETVSEAAKKSNLSVNEYLDKLPSSYYEDAAKQSNMDVKQYVDSLKSVWGESGDQIKKKDTSKNLSNFAATSSETSQSKLASGSGSTNETKDDSSSLSSTLSKVSPVYQLGEKFKTNDGMEFPSFGINENARKEIQQRISTGTTTPQDVETLSKSSGKSINAINVFLKMGIQKGLAVDNLENEGKLNTQLANTVKDFNKEFGTNYNADEVLSSSQKTQDFLHKMAFEATKQQYQKSQELKSSQPYSEANVPLQKIKERGFGEELNAFNQRAAKYQSLLKDHLVNKKILENKDKGISHEQTINELAQILNPEGYKQSLEASKERKPITQMEVLGAGYDYLFGNTKEKEDLLNSVKGGAEIKYNEGLKRIALNKISTGIVSDNKKLYEEGQSELKQVDDNVIYKYPSLVKREIARQVSEKMAQESGQLVGTETQDGKILEKTFGGSAADHLRIMKELGYLDNPKTKEIALSMAGHTELFSDASYFGSVGESFVEPIKNLAKSVGDMNGFRNQKDIFTDKLRDQQFPKEMEGLKENVSFVRSAMNTTANLAGMIAISAVTEGLASESGIPTLSEAKFAKAVKIGIPVDDVNIPFYKVTTEKLGAYTSFGIPSYDQSLKDSHDFLNNNASRHFYAAFNAVANAEGGRLLDLGKITRIPGLSKSFEKISQGLSEESISKSVAKELMNEGKNKFIDFAVKYGKNVTKGAATMAYFNTRNNVLKMAFGDPNTNAKDILPNAAHAFVDGITGMSIMGGFGAVADMRNEKNTIYKGNIYDLAINHDAAADIFKQGLKDGSYNQQQFDEKMQILNTARGAKASIDVIESERISSFNSGQKAVWVANKTAENVLKSKIEKTNDEELKNRYKSQIDRLSKQNTDILDGLKFNSVLEPLYDLHEAEKEYNKAQEEFNESGTEDDSKLLKAKEKYDNLYSQYFEQDKRKADEEVKSTEAKKAGSEDAKGETPKSAEAKTQIDFTGKENDLLSNKEPTIAQLQELNDVHKNLTRQYLEKHKELIKKGLRGNELENYPELVDIKEQMNKIEDYFNPSKAEKIITDNDIEKPNTEAIAGAKENVPVSTEEKGIVQKGIDKEGGVTEEGKTLKEDAITIGDMLDKKGTYKGERGTFIQEGQLVEFHTDKGNKIYELGNVDEVKGNSIKDYNIEQEESVIKLNEDGSIESGGKTYTNPNLENPLKAIRRGKDGNITGVTLENKNGKDVTFRGQRAEDLAYQLTLKEITKNNETRQQFEDFINTDEPTRKEIDNERLSEVAKKDTTKDISEIQREKIQPIKDISSQIKTTTDEESNKGGSEKSRQESDAKESNGKKGNEERLYNDVTPPLRGAESETAPLPKKEAVKIESVDEDDPLEVSLQRDRLMQDVKEAFYKPSDGSRSIADRQVLENAVNTIAREATNNGQSIKEHLENKINDWYSSLFDEKGQRIKDENGRDRQMVLTDEQQAMVGVYMLNLQKEIRDAKYNPASIIDAASLQNLEAQQIKAENIAGVAGEASGRSLRYLGQIYKINNNAEFELVKKQSAQVLGTEIPLDEKEFNQFAKGLTQKQRRSAEITRNALLKYKEKLDKSNEAWEKSESLTDEQFNQEVQKQVKLVVDKAIEEAKKNWESESKKAKKENKNIDSKGRVIKEKANDLANKLNDIADKLGGKGIAMNSPLGLVQITAKWVLKGIAEGIRQGGKIPELIARYMGEAKMKDEFKGHDEAKLLEQVHGSLSELGVDKKIFEAKPQSEISINLIKEIAKNSNTDFITKEAIANGLVKDLFHSLGEQGVSVDKIAEKAVRLLSEKGITTDISDINQAYLGRGKYKLETKKELDDAIKQVAKEISAHEKLQFDINEIDKKIKEIEQSGELSISKKDEKLQQLNDQKQAKLAEFDKLLTSKGIKLEKGSKFSRQQKEAVIESNNQAVKNLGENITNALNKNLFGDIKEGTKNFLRDLSKKLTHTINAHALEGQIDTILGKLKTALSDFERDHFTLDKRNNNKLLEVRNEISNLIKEVEKNRKKSSEEIKLNDYKKKLESDKKEFERKKAAGEWDDTKLSVDIKKDADAYKKQLEKNVAKYEYYRAQNAAVEALEPTWLKALKGVREVSRNMLLSGITGIQAKLGLSAITRQSQFLSKPIARLFGKITGVESLRNKTSLKTEWRSLKETVLTKTEKQGKEILEKSGEYLEKTLNDKNKAEENYRKLVQENGENSKEATQYKLNELQKANVDYNAAALKHAVNDIYNHITPLNKGGRWIILKEGITREEQEAGLLGKKETLRDYLKKDFDQMNDEEAAVEYRKGLKSLPSKLKEQVKAGIFYSRMIVRSHGVWKDIPARHELVKGYINRLQDAQEKGQDISDMKVKSKLWIDAVLNDMQEAKFQNKNLVVNWIRSGQKAIGGEGWIQNKNIKEAVGAIVESATPVLKVPMNIYKTSMQYAFGSILGTIKTADIIYKSYKSDMSLKEFANTKMTDEQKYNLQTLIGRGAVGAALMAWSFYATKNGSLITGGSYPDKKKNAILSDGSEVELEYGDIVINGHLLPHLVSKALAHLPPVYAALIGNDVATAEMSQTGNKNPHAFVEGLIETAQKMVTDIPGLPLERDVDKYGETTLSLKNPWSYLGYIGAVKDAEKALGVEPRAPEYLLTTPEKYFNRSGLIFLVPTKEEAKERLKQQKEGMSDAANKIREEHPELFKK